MSLLSLLFFLLSDTVISHSCSSDTACLFVDNQCPFTLYLQRTAIDGTDESVPTTVTTLANKQQTVLDIDGWKGLPGQRLYAWWQNPVGNNLNPLTYRDKVEINRCQTVPQHYEMCYNPTAVDYFALPVAIAPYNSSDCPSVPTTGAYNIKADEIKSECPTEYEVTSPHGVCLSPQRVCANDESNEICSHFDSVIAQCVKDGICSNDLTTTQVYACSDSVSQEPRLCAAINRGMYSYYGEGGNDANHSLFYQLAPYNEYAKFIHTGNAKEYAFPYDDYQGDGASGYQTCDTNFLSVTFCPGSGDISTTLTPRHATTATTACGYVPAACEEDLKWAVSNGIVSNPEWYPDFTDVTGVDLLKATEEDMQLYWFCTGANPNDHCAGLQIPCNRVCATQTTTANPSSSSTTATATQETSRGPTSSPVSTTKTPASKQSSGDTKKQYGVEAIVVAICVGFVCGVLLTLIVMVLYQMHTRKKQHALRESLNEQLLGSISDDNAAGDATDAGQRL